MEFTELYQEHYQQLLRLAKRYLLPEDAEDVVHDVMTTLWERREAMELIEHPVSYAFSAIKNKCLDHVKHENYKREYCRRTLAAIRMDFQMEDIPTGSTASTNLENDEMEIRLSRAISELPPRCRTIFQLRRLKGKGFAEISEMLGISLNTVGCQMAIAQKRLRTRLKVS